MLLSLSCGNTPVPAAAGARSPRIRWNCLQPSSLITWTAPLRRTIHYWEDWTVTLLRWALLFFVISVIAGILGFTGISAASADIARILFYIFLVIFLVLLVLGLTVFRV